MYPAINDFCKITVSVGTLVSHQEWEISSKHARISPSKIHCDDVLFACAVKHWSMASLSSSPGEIHTNARQRTFPTQVQGQASPAVSVGSDRTAS